MQYLRDAYHQLSMYFQYKNKYRLTLQILNIPVGYRSLNQPNNSLDRNLETKGFNPQINHN